MHIFLEKYCHAEISVFFSLSRLIIYYRVELPLYPLPSKDWFGYSVLFTSERRSLKKEKRNAHFTQFLQVLYIFFPTLSTFGADSPLCGTTAVIKYTILVLTG